MQNQHGDWMWVYKPVSVVDRSKGMETLLSGSILKKRNCDPEKGYEEEDLKMGELHSRLAPVSAHVTKEQICISYPD